MGRHSKTGRPRQDEGWELTGRVIEEISAGSRGVLAWDGYRRCWSEERRERVEGMRRMDEAARSEEEVEGEFERWDQKKYGGAGWEAMKKENWTHRGVYIVKINYKMPSSYSPEWKRNSDKSHATVANDQTSSKKGINHANTVALFFDLNRCLKTCRPLQKLIWSAKDNLLGKWRNNLYQCSTRSRRRKRCIKM